MTDFIEQVKVDMQGNTEERTHVAKYDVATQLEDGDQIAILRPMGNDYYKVLKADKSLLGGGGGIKELIIEDTETFPVDTTQMKPVFDLSLLKDKKVLFGYIQATTIPRPHLTFFNCMFSGFFYPSTAGNEDELYFGGTAPILSDKNLAQMVAVAGYLRSSTPQYERVEVNFNRNYAGIEINKCTLHLFYME